MKPCPKCNGSVPDGKTTCPHCGLVLHKWEASQQHLAAEPVEPPIIDEPESREKENLSFLVGWVGGVLPPIAIMVVAYNYLEGHKRKAFQALVATWWSMPIFIARIFASYRPSPFNDLITAVIPLITLYLVRRLDWPINTPSEKSEPKDFNAYLYSRRIAIGLTALLLVVIGLVGHQYPIDTNLFFMMMSAPAFIYGCYALIQVIKSLVKPVSLPKRLDNVLKLGLSVVFVVMFISVMGASVRVTEAKMKTVIAALDEYYSVQGHYAECPNPAPPVPRTDCNSLKMLIPEYLARVPSCQQGWMSYWTHEDGSYTLACHYLLFTKLAYDSGTDRWYSYD